MLSKILRIILLISIGVFVLVYFHQLQRSRGVAGRIRPLSQQEELEQYFFNCVKDPEELKQKLARLETMLANKVLSQEMYVEAKKNIQCEPGSYREKKLSQMNQSAFSQDPIEIAKSHPLSCGDNQGKILTQWGNPIWSSAGISNAVLEHPHDIDHWKYAKYSGSTGEADAMVPDNEGKLVRRAEKVDGISETYVVLLQFRNGKLAATKPALDSINKGLIPENSENFYNRQELPCGTNE